MYYLTWDKETTTQTLTQQGGRRICAYKLTTLYMSTHHIAIYIQMCGVYVHISLGSVSVATLVGTRLVNLGQWGYRQKQSASLHTWLGGGAVVL